MQAPECGPHSDEKCSICFTESAAAQDLGQQEVNDLKA